MLPITEAFTFEYAGSEIIYGRESAGWLDELLGSRGLNRALVICGSNVGVNKDVMGPVTNGLGDRLAGVFDETTPAKSADTVYDGIEQMRDLDPDVLVGVGGGSSLDIARQISVFAADGRPLSAFLNAAHTGRALTPDPQEPLTPVVVVPTTFAGADISGGGSVEFLPREESPTGDPVRISGSAMPEVVLFDPNLYATTPMGALAGSAMNGFDKGLETIYARTTSPIGDAAAVHGLRLLSDAFPKLPNDPDALERAVVGIILVQFKRQISVIHAFGHGFARSYPIQQGVIHAVLVPHILRYILEKVDGRRALLAEGLGIDATGLDAEVADRIVKEVTAVRDSFDLPTRLREVDPVTEEDLLSLAKFILKDSAMKQAPPGLDLSVEEIESVLRDAW